MNPLAFLEAWQRARRYTELRALYRAVTGDDVEIRPYQVLVLERLPNGKLSERFEEHVSMRPP